MAPPHFPGTHNALGSRASRTHLDLVAQPLEGDKSRFRSDDKEAEYKLQPETPKHGPPGHLQPIQRGPDELSSPRAILWGQGGMRAEARGCSEGLWLPVGQAGPSQRWGLLPVVTSSLDFITGHTLSGSETGAAGGSGQV